MPKRAPVLESAVTVTGRADSITGACMTLALKVTAPYGLGVVLYVRCESYATSGESWRRLAGRSPHELTCHATTGLFQVDTDGSTVHFRTEDASVKLPASMCWSLFERVAAASAAAGL